MIKNTIFKKQSQKFEPEQEIGLSNLKMVRRKEAKNQANSISDPFDNLIYKGKSVLLLPVINRKKVIRTNAGEDPELSHTSRSSSKKNHSSRSCMSLPKIFKLTLKKSSKLKMPELSEKLMVEKTLRLTPRFNESHYAESSPVKNPPIIKREKELTRSQSLKLRKSIFKDINDISFNSHKIN